MKHKLIDLVKGTTAKFTHFKNGKLYYNIEVEDMVYIIPIDVTDANEIGEARFNKEEKASMLMRYIRKAIESEEIMWLT